MQAIGPIKPAIPTGSVQDRQVISLQDRVSSKIEKESLDRKKFCQNESEDTRGDEALALLLPTARQLPRQHILGRVRTGAESLSALQAATAGPMRGTESEAGHLRGPFEENETTGTQRRDGEQAETALGHRPAARNAKAVIASPVGLKAPTETAKVNPRGLPAITGVGIAAVTAVANPGESVTPLVGDRSGMEGAAHPAEASSATPFDALFDGRKAAAKHIIEDLSTESTPTARHMTSSFGHQALFDRVTTHAKANATLPRPLRADADGAVAQKPGAKATRPGASELTYRFQSWGDGHAVKAHIASQGAVMFNPSSMRVNAALALARTESAGATAWRIDATDASGDDDSTRKRRQ